SLPRKCSTNELRGRNFCAQKQRLESGNRYRISFVRGVGCHRVALPKGGAMRLSPEKVPSFTADAAKEPSIAPVRFRYARCASYSTHRTGARPAKVQLR